MLVTKLGDELAVRLPQEVVDVLGLKEGDAVDVKPAGERSVAIERMASTSVETDPDKRWEIIRQLRQMRGWLPDDFKFDRDEANER